MVLSQIEKANLTDLDWALANMEARAKQPTAKGDTKWVYEAETKGRKEDVRIPLRPLFVSLTPMTERSPWAWGSSLRRW